MGFVLCTVKMFSNIPGLCLFDAMASPLPIARKKISPDIAKYPSHAKSRVVEKHWNNSSLTFSVFNSPIEDGN